MIITGFVIEILMDGSRFNPSIPWLRVLHFRPTYTVVKYPSKNCPKVYNFKKGGNWQSMKPMITYSSSNPMVRESTAEWKQANMRHIPAESTGLPVQSLGWVIESLDPKWRRISVECLLNRPFYSSKSSIK